MLRRRGFIVGLGGLTSLLGYSLYRGIRTPPFIWGPRQPPNRFHQSGVSFSSNDVIRIGESESPDQLSFRSFVAEPSLSISIKKKQKVTFSVTNISEKALLSSGHLSMMEEVIDGTSREVTATGAATNELKLHWRIPVENGFRFTAIGDTGGREELNWCIQRSYELGALFFLHLGDINYTRGDYDSAIATFNNAPLPCFVSIGNHDFHDRVSIYQKFLDEIGPFNSSFVIGGARFTNIDTASNIYPYGAGPRGHLLESLAQQSKTKTHIAFTHRPLFDPLPDSTHDIGSAAERDWLIQALKNSGASTLLSGHLHIFARQRIAALDNIIVGQGLGHQDLITNQDYSKIALGKVDAGGAVEFEFPSLSMPWERHCHPRTNEVKESLSNSPHASKIEQLNRHCNELD